MRCIRKGRGRREGEVEETNGSFIHTVGLIDDCVVVVVVVFG